MSSQYGSPHHSNSMIRGPFELPPGLQDRVEWLLRDGQSGRHSSSNSFNNNSNSGWSSSSLPQRTNTVPPSPTTRFELNHQRHSIQSREVFYYPPGDQVLHWGIPPAISPIANPGPSRLSSTTEESQSDSPPYPSKTITRRLSLKRGLSFGLRKKQSPERIPETSPSQDSSRGSKGNKFGRRQRIVFGWKVGKTQTSSKFRHDD